MEKEGARALAELGEFGVPKEGFKQEGSFEEIIAGGEFGYKVGRRRK